MQNNSVEQSSYNVLAPGPVNLHPKVREALALPMIHHRTPEFDKILVRVLQNLKEVFHTKESVFMMSATGSGGMEALLVNVLSPGDQVLCIDSGKFGERWTEMAKTYQAQVHTIKCEWGHALKVGEVAEKLQKHPEIKIVLTQACETSTGVLHPIRELAEVISRHENTLLLVDGITALGALPLPMDEWKIDGLVGGSQKAFMLPTGLTFLAYSKKAWEKVLTAKTPRYYFDVRKEQKANQNSETFFSSNVTLIRALDVVLEMILSEGLHQHFLQISHRANFTRHFAPDLGFKLYAESPSNSLTALTVPAGFDGQKIRAHLEEKFRITVMGGQDQAKGKIIRIGHMGHITWEQMQHLMLSLHSTLTDLQPSYKAPKADHQLALEMKAWAQHV
jgi:aspartate aminotransferase-like enzyme